MGKFISKFDTVAEFAAFSATTAYSEPHVTLIKDGTGVEFIPDPYNGHEYVDLGLTSGTLWATMNVGATAIAGASSYGNYYQYGKGASQYAATSGNSNYSGTEDPLATTADTAAQVWGGSWHMPTRAQFQELIDQCTWTLKSIDGTYGYSVSKNGKSIFLPFGGEYDSGNPSGVGSRGVYWTSTPTSNVISAYMFSSASTSKFVDGNGRKHGYTVRPVVG